jgi:hypothetical protein
MIRPQNDASIRLARRLGMAPLRTDVLLGDAVVVFSINRDDSTGTKEASASFPLATRDERASRKRRGRHQLDEARPSPRGAAGSVERDRLKGELSLRTSHTTGRGTRIDPLHLPAGAGGV